MRANEIRMGVWMHNPVQGIDFQVTEENIGAVISNHSREPYEAIPLTEEWLVKFGFGAGEFWDEMVDNVSLKDTIINCNYEIGYLELEGETESFYINNIKYVHQLQNLYFALTGEELTIKK